MIKRDTRQLLIETGMKLITEKGYHGVGLKEILDSAHIPKGSFYNYFPSKEAFGAAIVEVFAAQSAAQIRAALSDRRESADKRLRRFYQSLRDQHNARNSKGCCLIAKLGSEISELSPLIRSALKSACEQWLVLVAQCIRDGQIEGVFSSEIDSEALARFIHDAWEGALIRAQIEQSSAPLDNFLQHVFEHLLKQ